MREIKFRAWDKKLKCMYSTDSISLCIDGEICYLDTDGEWVTDMSNRIMMMQYTGLKDCQGIEIYEGDIIGFDDCTSTESGYWEQQCIGVVEWCDETVSFEVSNRLSAESYEVLSECLVVGNIYENPDLCN